MNNYKNFFKNKKITVMGLGLLGRGVGDSVFLAEAGANLTITDLKTKEQLKESLRKLEKFKSPRHGGINIKYVLGGHKIEDFQNADLILKAAGVPLDSVYIKEALKNKIPVEMSASLFTKFTNVPVIGVTGTRGKSTVTHLIAYILESAGKKIILGGNVRGVSNLQLLKKMKGIEYVVFELDSWQLQGFGDNKISPNISVFTTFYPDHMGYYKGDMKKYFDDKANIFKYQKDGDILVAGSQALSFIKKWEKENTPHPNPLLKGEGKIRSKIIIPKEKLPKVNNKPWKFILPGEHNEYNAMLAVEVARNLGIPDTKIKKALASFKGVEGRLQFVRSLKGVNYYNDTTATTPEATIVALKALGHSMSKLKNIILIAGGSDKGLIMDNLLKEIKKYCKEVILLSGTGTERIKDQVKNITKNYVEVGNMKDAVKKAKEFSKRGDTVLLSPSFSSFGMFKNEYDRGDQFMKIVKALK